ncbi:conserved Plasmodium protein, unknown function [Plasmodium ovale wallikeri]|uniref:Alpha/beta hydrolase n=2 Tax=Plasmodium ovale TaxID=36330 RepID=A0A1C3KTY0_PLAOA|nr:conserved Plasmodium protein, unknown function [Plasmodium ovale wallikeri]SBT77625.1 conserved Plasmodium protein, unknown function [Plasmodium ovale]
MFCKEKVIANCKKKKNEIKEVTRKYLNLIDFKYNKLTSVINKKNNSDILTNYHFSDDEIKFYSDENCSNDIYVPESSYTNNDFKNLLGWVPRNLKIEEPISTDSIPCAFLFSNDDKSIKSNKIILYLHKFNEDLGTIIPTIHALHKKLSINIIAMEYSGYGASFDNHKQKLVSIVNDVLTILKFILTYLKIEYRNIYILCYEFLASCVIEAVNRLEYVQGKKATIGGIVFIKPQLLQINNKNVPLKKNDNIVLTDVEDTSPGVAERDIVDEFSHPSVDEDIVMDEDHVKREKHHNTRVKAEDGKIGKVGSAVRSSVSSSVGCGMNKWEDNSVAKNGLYLEGETGEFCNTHSSNEEYPLISNYHELYNGIVSCDMSLFYNDSSKYVVTEDNDIPYSLMKRILKDTFDINHVINSIKSISCSVLIFHPENYFYRNSSSHILLSNAKECCKKAAFSFDFMNEDFVTAFKWFFSEQFDYEKKEKLFKNLLYLYIHPTLEGNNINASNEMSVYSNHNTDDDSTYKLGRDCSRSLIGDSYNENFSNNVNLNSNKNDSALCLDDHHSDKSSDIYAKKCSTYCSRKNGINIPDEIFVCPDMIQEGSR